MLNTTATDYTVHGARCTVHAAALFSSHLVVEHYGARLVEQLVDLILAVPEQDDVQNEDDVPDDQSSLGIS